MTNSEALRDFRKLGGSWKKGPVCQADVRHLQ
jgi:hypothetical protein